MLSSKEVQHIAKLARIGLTDEEILRFQKDIGSILEYFEILRGVDSTALPDNTTTSVSSLSNLCREDVAKTGDPKDTKHLLEMAPAAQDGYLQVKSIL